MPRIAMTDRYAQYKDFMQMMCDDGAESACPGYVEPPPPPPPPPSSYGSHRAPPPPPSSGGGGSDIGDKLWDMANDKDGAQVMWVCFTHFFISIFRPVASFMLCCCKEPPVSTTMSQEPQQMQMQPMQPQMPMQPQQQQQQQQQVSSPTVACD